MQRDARLIDPPGYAGQAGGLARDNCCAISSISIDADDNQVAAQAIKLLLLTGARRNEITHAKWEHVDWQRRTLLVPMSKSGKPRTIALNGAAIALLQSIPRVKGSEYIFPSPYSGHPFASLLYLRSHQAPPPPHQWLDG